MSLSSKQLFALICLLIAGGCTTASLKELRQTTPTGNAFQAALAAEYLAFSESEARQYDWPDSKHFADKGLRAAYGNDTAPENPADWDIDDAVAIEQLLTARGELDAAFATGAKDLMPKIAARAQFFYDCWVEQQEEAWQEEDINSCKHGFYEALEAMEPEPEPAPEPIAEPEPQILSSSYLVFFEFDSAAITPEGRIIIDTVVQDLSGVQDYEVILHGHADRSGSVSYNLALSKKRAEAVKAALVARNVPENLIRYFAYGESDPRVPTPDGKREQANRRVEIFFD